MLVSCTVCGTDVYVEDFDDKADMAACLGPGHPGPRMFQPKAELNARAEKARTRQGLPDGIAASLGLYELLPRLVGAHEWVDTCVVEYRYGIENPRDYEWMLERWGHIVQGERNYSTTSFVGSTLGDLSRAGLVSYKEGRGSGRFRYNSTLGFWSAVPASRDALDVGWADFAPTVGADPESWPLVTLP